MTEYRVHFTKDYIDVEAERFEIEGGVLVFHQSEDTVGSLGEMTADSKIRAFNDWRSVERL